MMGSGVPLTDWYTALKETENNETDEQPYATPQCAGKTKALDADQTTKKKKKKEKKKKKKKWTTTKSKKWRCASTGHQWT